MDDMKSVNLGEVMNTIRGSGRPNTVLWQAPDSIAFVARGREFRSEFHSDPSDEVMYMIRGDMNLHYRTPEGDEKIVVVREGEIVHCPAGTHIALDQGDTFGPFVAGPDGVVLFEVMMGDPRSFPADEDGYARFLAERGVQQLPNPPIDLPEFVEDARN